MCIMVYNVLIFAIFTNVKKYFLFFFSLEGGGGGWDGIVDVVEERESVSRHFFLVGEKSFLVKLKVKHFEDVPLVELCTLYLHACQVRVTVGDSGLCCCTCVTHFEH